AQIAKWKEEAAKKGPVAMAKGWLGPSGYLSITKLLLFILVFFCWVFTLDWISRDGEKLQKSDRLTWNMINFFPYVIIGTIFFYLPVATPILFFITLPLVILTWIVPAICYVTSRNKPLPPFERVMTYEHIKYVIASILIKVGIRIKVQKKMEYQKGEPIEIDAIGKDIDEKILTGRTILARNNPGFNLLRTIIFDALEQKADGVMFEYNPDKTVMRFQIDGVWIDSQTYQKEQGDMLLEASKLLVGGKPEEKRPRLGGMFRATIRKKTKFNAELVIQTAQNGLEKQLITFVIQKVPFDTLEDLGMRPELQEKVKELINAPSGLVVFSSLPANGLRSTINVTSRTADRFTRDFATVEDIQNPFQEVENVMLNTYDSKKGETPISVLPDVFFREPNALLIRDFVNVETFALCCKEIVENNRLIISTIRGRDAAETFLRLLALKIDPQLFATTIKSVVSQRLIRKLCPDCKEAFEPQPALLQRLGLPPGKIAQLYRVRSAPQPGEKRKPCLTCNDIGFKGRTAMFEIIEVNDDIRKILVTKPSVEALRKAANQSGQKSFMFEGALLVAKGITSVEELARVMK
ncbi:MAG: ATPase, T2SS/T4P/T4SS family, partial [Thermoguttaceae bacterium]